MSTTVKNPGESQDEVKAPNAMDVKKGVENHKQAAVHHEAAAKHHLEAAKHHEEGNHDKAHTSTVHANGHSILATDLQREDAKHHALSSK